LLIAPSSAATDPAQLRQILITGDVSVMQATPATWRMLLEAGWEGIPGLRILCGGEALPAELADRLGDLGSELWNLYGPTETTIWSTIYRVQSEAQPTEPAAGDAIPIGRPIANTQIYILDADLRRVAIGVPGDLYIGGHGLAQGYHGQPRLTEEKFIAHPFSQDASARLYHTGDRARHRRDGNVEYLGRTDHQVKIRGFRIETGEVEARLVAHDQVHEALVIATKNGPDLALVAYLVGEPVPATELREWLRRQLPDYMVASVFMHLDALPLSPSGKIDRGALPQPDIDAGLRANHYAEPRDELEKTITDAWEDALGVGHVGILDDFFELGGHSLTATRIIFRLQRDCGLTLQLMDLFRCPTVEGLAAVARSRGTGASDPAGDGTSGSEDTGIDEMTAEELAMLEE
jgi:acyl-coenzyme A synthetase/AMP-(fatty) acid ligase